jgi:predicted nuclease of predicted toxin-antitoxin system
LHHIETPGDAGILGDDDIAQLAYAQVNDLILVTRDADDFTVLHQRNPSHPGIFVIHDDGDSRDMDNQAIARAIQNLANAGVPIRNEIHVLNAWNY